MNHTGDGLGGILISSDDWKKVHELETRARAKIDEAKINLWAIKKSLSDDVGRLVKVGSDIKIAVIAGALVGTLHTLAAMSGAVPRSSTDDDDPSRRPRRWRDSHDDSE
jgi:hypothetical protein